MEYSKYKGRKIIIAEDNKDSMMFLDIVLKKGHAETLCVENGVELIELLHRNSNIDLVFLDIKMPEMDGLEACRIIKKKFPDIPVVAATAYAGTKEIDKMIDVGIVDILVKPIVPKSIYNILDKHLK